MCPVKLPPPAYLTNNAISAGGRVCGIDVGVNTAATAAIVDTNGTVIARRFLTCGRHNDQRDRLHRRIANISREVARVLSAGLLAFARAYGAKVFVIEDLKSWKPKGGNRTQRPRFHRFQHRALVQALAYKAQEFGIRVMEIFARGTSRWAFDGSGKIRRDKANYSLATFASGKQYNADLNAAYNIAARGLAMILGIKKADAGRSPASAERMPFVLADVWAWVRSCAPVHTSLETH